MGLLGFIYTSTLPIYRELCSSG